MRWLSSHFHLYSDLPASASGMLISEPMELRWDEFLEESSAFQWNYRFNSSATTMTYAHSNPTTCIFEEWKRALELDEKMCQIRRALSQMSTVSPNPDIILAMARIQRINSPAIPVLTSTYQYYIVSLFSPKTKTTCILCWCQNSLRVIPATLPEPSVVRNSHLTARNN